MPKGIPPPIGNAGVVLKTMFAAAGALVLVAGLTAPLSARVEPAGSYRSSCAQIRMESEHILAAECHDNRRIFHETRIDVRTCPHGDIANRNGKLVCERR